MARQKPTPQTEEEWEQYFQDQSAELMSNGLRMKFYSVRPITSTTGDVVAYRFIFSTAAINGETCVFHMSLDKFVSFRDTLNGYVNLE